MWDFINTLYIVVFQNHIIQIRMKCDFTVMHNFFSEYYDDFAQIINLWGQKTPLVGEHIPYACNNRRIAVSITIEEFHFF
jgi:hypothetical protein